MGKTLTSNKPRGWFSRRHMTDGAHREAVNRYLAEHSRAARKDKARLRDENRALLSSEEQYERLNRRLGGRVKDGRAAIREGDRLRKSIDLAK